MSNKPALGDSHGLTLFYISKGMLYDRREILFPY
jgi:hypothetical protein